MPPPPPPPPTAAVVFAACRFRCPLPLPSLLLVRLLVLLAGLSASPGSFRVQGEGRRVGSPLGERRGVWRIAESWGWGQGWG